MEPTDWGQRKSMKKEIQRAREYRIWTGILIGIFGSWRSSRWIGPAPPRHSSVTKYTLNHKSLRTFNEIRVFEWWKEIKTRPRLRIDTELLRICSLLTYYQKKLLYKILETRNCTRNCTTFNSINAKKIGSDYWYPRGTYKICINIIKATFLIILRNYIWYTYTFSF